MGDTYIFIDESGDLGSSGTDHFVVAALITKNPAELDRIIKNARRNKFRKILKNAQELKANSAKDDLRKWILQKWVDTKNPNVQAVVLDKGKVYSSFLKNDRHKLYNYVCGQLAGIIASGHDRLIIRIDKSKGKQTLRDDFDEYLKRKLKEQKWNIDLQVHHSYSHAWPGLQIADFLAWSILRKEEHDDSRFFSIIEEYVSLQRVWE